MIDFNNVKKSYPNGTLALDGVDLHIEDGEFVFIVGHSGAGKTTMMKLLLCEERPTSGKITVWCGIEKDKKTILVTVKDQGVGIENVEQAMEPLYTTRPDMDRSGMGFAFMEAFMDEVQVESVPGKGTTVWMKKTTGGEKKEAVWTTQSH